MTTSVAGVSAQKLRHLDVLLIAPWTVTVDLATGLMKVVIANSVCYIVQKLLISGKRSVSEVHLSALSWANATEATLCVMPVSRGSSPNFNYERD